MEYLARSQNSFGKQGYLLFLDFIGNIPWNKQYRLNFVSVKAVMGCSKWIYNRK